MNPAQTSALKAALLADANIAAFITGRDVQSIVSYLQGDSTFVVYRNNTPASDIYDAVAWATLTPTDVPDGTQLWTNRALMCQCKQMNLQIMVQGKDSVNTGKINIRVGLQDALTNIPSGVAGANASGGWGAVKTAISRIASVYEHIFATGMGTAASPGSLVIEGAPSITDIATTLYNPDGSMK